MNDILSNPTLILFERYSPAALALVNRAREEIGLSAIAALGRPRWRSPWDNVLVEAVRQDIHGTRPRDMRPEVEATAEGLWLHFPWEDTLCLPHTPDSQSFMALLEAGTGSATGRRRGCRGGRRRRRTRELAPAS